ncbi:GntR family transcriptional regulator [Teredinibacter turnerae]|uniref:Transcriptional regulator, GntR family n=1 Tax=Teredinibacter turnerae (strain ATCC 39867 / T7901) TaxID=377629 RepID=C5BNU2_TERTT|nr:GntR family transcriptional regulator [Teredinibacter turnerae]ACR11651.1 transcriptional regulator, GntR family [Teredinibacter turnerae T7901]
MKKSGLAGVTDKNNYNINFDHPTPDQIFAFIRDEIVGMVLKPGEKIPENQMAEKFGVSRTPVREAIVKLANLGFVEVRPQRGTFVTKLSMPLILEARFIREAIEIAVVSSLAQMDDPSVLHECENILEQQVVAANAQDAMTFQYLDDEFHRALAGATGYSRVSKVIEAEKAHMDRVRNLSLVELTGQYEQVLTQHKAIIKAIKSGSVEDAKAAMGYHMKDVFNILQVAPEQHPEYFI